MTDEDRVARALYEHETGRSDWDEETAWMDERQRAWWLSLARAACAAMSQWQPIETAPKDGTQILTWMPSDLDPSGYHIVGDWYVNARGDGYWQDQHGEGFEPTHWQSLPPPPGDKLSEAPSERGDTSGT